MRVGDAGRIASRETTSEDITHPVQDGAARLAMLQDYRKRLLSLQSTAAKDIQSLVKLAEQLAMAQSQIEQSEANQKQLLSRVARDRLTIYIKVAEQDDLLSPIKSAFTNVPRDFTESIGAVIRLAAMLLPFSLVLWPAIVLFRRWRKRRAQAAG